MPIIYAYNPLYPLFLHQNKLKITIFYKHIALYTKRAIIIHREIVYY